jgi:hypothetical protein
MGAPGVFHLPAAAHIGVYALGAAGAAATAMLQPLQKKS